jgi:hypothetical protein
VEACSCCFAAIGFVLQKWLLSEGCAGWAYWATSAWGALIDSKPGSLEANSRPFGFVSQDEFNTGQFESRLDLPEDLD